MKRIGFLLILPTLLFAGGVNNPSGGSGNIDTLLPTQTANSGKFLTTNGTTSSWGAAGAGDALTTQPLSQFAATTSLQLAGVLSDETGTGAVVLSTSPTLVTPALGTPTSLTLTNATGLPESGVTSLVSDLALKAPLASPTFTGTVTVPTGSALGTPTTLTLTNATGLPISTGVSGLGTGVGTFLGTPTSANMAAALTDETGTGAAVFGTNPVIATPTINTQSSAIGVTEAFSATAPAVATTTTAGSPVTITASSAIAGSATAGAAVGGDVTISAGDAARLTSGNAVGGNIILRSGVGIGTSKAGLTKILTTTGVAADINSRHLIGGSNAPTIATGTGAGTTPGTPTVNGTDQGGQITVITGTTPPASSVIATITYNVAYNGTSPSPYVVISPGNAPATNLGQVPFTTSALASFTLTSGTTALTASQTYIYNYVVIQ